MKRHPALIPLSHDHHDALSVARRLKRSADAPEPEIRIDAARAFIAFFDGETTRHFREEEELVFPLLAPEHPLVRRAVTDHARLRALVSMLDRDVDSASVTGELVTRIATELETHIRFEERELFEAVQREVAAAELETVRTLLPGPPPTAA